MNGNQVDENYQVSEKKLVGKRCVACFEVVHVQARRCPHCQANQLDERIQVLGQITKGIGAVLLILTLLSVSLYFSSLAQTQTDRADIVNDLLSAAELQVQNGEFGAAWDSVAEAINLQPDSRPVREKQALIAMRWLREEGGDYRDLEQLSAEISPALYRSAASKESEAAASALAHLAWIRVLRSQRGGQSDDIDELFQLSLEKDPSNVYAHAMWAFWISSPRNQQAYAEGATIKAQTHFQKALNGDEDLKPYVRGLQFSLLLEAERFENQVQALLVADDMRLHSENLNESMQLRLLDLFRPLVRVDGVSRASGKTLLSQMAPQKLLENFKWLSQPFDLKEQDSQKFERDTRALIQARLTEESGDLNSALNLYKELQDSVTVRMYQRVLLEPIEQGIARVNAMLQKGPTNVGSL